MLIRFITWVEGLRTFSHICDVSQLCRKLYTFTRVFSQKFWALETPCFSRVKVAYIHIDQITPRPPRPAQYWAIKCDEKEADRQGSLLFITGAPSPLSCLAPTNREPFISGRDMRVAGYEICPRRTWRPPPNKTTSCPLHSTQIWTGVQKIAIQSGEKPKYRYWIWKDKSPVRRRNWKRHNSD